MFLGNKTVLNAQSTYSPPQPTSTVKPFLETHVDLVLVRFQV
jgi:hypothetical protein